MKKFSSLVVCLLFIGTYTFAQSIDFNLFKNYKPRSIGPAAMSGRINAVVAVNNDPNTMYVGAASGGVWKSTNGGTSWQPIFDNESTQAIGSIALHQSNPSLLWVGTGEGNPRNSMNTGRGIFKSIDAGKTWKHMGLESTRTIHRLIIHRDNPDIVFAGTMGSPWGPNSERGVYKTTDGGKSWRRVLYINDTTGIADLISDPNNPNKLIAATWHYYRKPWTLQSGGKGSGLHISYDAGETWTKITDGLPAGDLGRMGLAIATNKSNILYALVEAKKNGLYKSTDGGHKWAFVSDKNIGNRPFYYNELYVDPKNENRLYNLYSSIDRSDDGGKTFVSIGGGGNFGGVHPDHHAFYINPENTEFLILGNDGGAYISRNGGDDWQFMSNIPIGQFYHVNIDNEMPYNIYGGLQDNGTWVGPSAVLKASGLRSHEWQEVYFGDGFDAMPRKDNARYLFAMSQGGNLGYVDRLTGKSMGIKPQHPNDIDLRFNWNAALAQDPFTDCGIYYGSQYVHYSPDCGQSWNTISSDLTTNNPSKQKQNESGGLTIDATGAENHCTILAIAPSPKDQKVIWAGTDDGQLQLTRDGGQSWTNLTSRINGMPANAWIPQIEVSSKNAAEVFVVVNNYRQNDFKPYLFYSADYGQSWKNLALDKTITGFVWSVVQDPVVSNLLFLGTEEGLLLSFNMGATWQKWTNGFPSVPVADMKIHPREHDLVMTTFGRSHYILDDISPLREIAKGAMVLNKPLRLFPMKEAYQWQTRSVDGERFTGDAMYIGTNKTLGAVLNLWIKDSAAASPEARKEVSIKVYDALGKNIRNLTRRIENGYNKLTWNLDRKGELTPSYGGGGGFGGGGGRFGGGGADAEPGGITILPGTYKIVVQYGKEKDSSMVEVKQDPRLPVPMESLLAKQKALDENLGRIKDMKSIFDKLLEARKTITAVNEAMAEAPDSVKTKLTKSGKDLDQSIQSLLDLYLTPQDFKGIDRSDRLVGTLFRGLSFVNSADGATPINGMVALKNADARIRTARDKVLAFFNGDWKKYKESVTAVPFSLFQKVDKIKVE